VVADHQRERLRKLAPFLLIPRRWLEDFLDALEPDAPFRHDAVQFNRRHHRKKKKSKRSVEIVIFQQENMKN
jgi:hypothetical protein